MLGGRAMRRIITPELGGGFAIHGVGVGSGCGFGSGSSSGNDTGGDVRMNDSASVLPGLHRAACAPSRQRGESDQSPPPSSWKKPTRRIPRISFGQSNDREGFFARLKKTPFLNRYTLLSVAMLSSPGNV